MKHFFMEKENIDEVFLKKQNEDNMFILSWMWVILIGAIAMGIFIKNFEYKIFWVGCATFVLVFITSLRMSIKQNKIIMLILEESKGD